MKKTLLVMSGKGGVGKTTIAVNISYFLSNKGKVVGILDADIHGPNVLKLTGTNKEKMGVQNGKMIPIYINPSLKAASIAGLIDDNSAVIWRGPMKHKALKQFIEDVNWGNIDYLIVDFPPGTGDELISVVQLLKDVSGLIIVSTPQEVSILDAMRAVDFSKKMNVPIIGLIENMSGEVFGGGTIKKVCKKYNLNFLGSLPLSKDVVLSSDKGKPFYLYNKELNKKFNLIIKNILKRIK